jgi:hypothetical protein
VRPFRLVLPLVGDHDEPAGSLTCVVELYLDPGARHFLSTPTDPQPRRLARVLQLGRPVGGWTPGYKVLEMVTLELEPAPVADRARLLTLGWTATA